MLHWSPMRTIVPAMLTLLLIGAGCAPVTAPQVAEPISEAFPNRPVSQLRGFGDIPTVPAPVLRPGTRGSVRLLADIPEVPANVMVLKVNDGRPTDTLLRNASNALSLPGGILGEAPIGEDISIQWKDANGVRWTAAANGRQVTFSDETRPIGALTVSALPSNDEAIRIARTFFQDHGVNMTRYGQPYVSPDWSAWWETQKAAGRCMNASTLTAIRALSASAAWEGGAFPPLDTISCTNPEFPSRMIVNFNATQDGQGLFLGNGTPQIGARILVDVSAGRVSSGFFTISADPLRSDYPGVSRTDARDRMLRGGQGGTPNGDVTIKAIRFEWLPMEDTNDPPTRFLYPALVGEGTIDYPDRTSGPYRIVVPLVQ
jgi:hypothetical protein